MTNNRAIHAFLVTAATAGIVLSAAGTAAAAPADSTHPVAGGLNQQPLWNGIQTFGNGIHSGINVLFGGAYGGGGNPAGSDQGTWWYALAAQLDNWSHNYNQHGHHTCYDGDTPYPCG